MALLIRGRLDFLFKQYKKMHFLTRTPCYFCYFCYDGLRLFKQSKLIPADPGRLIW